MRLLVAFALFCSTVGHLGSLSAQGSNIDLAAVGGTPPATFGAAAMRAGHWNSIHLPFTGGLLDVKGELTPVAISITADNGSGFFAGECSRGTRALVSDNVFTTAGSWSAGLSGLADGLYKVTTGATQFPER